MMGAFTFCVCTVHAQEGRDVEVITEPPPPAEPQQSPDVEPRPGEEPLPTDRPQEEAPEKPEEPIGHLRVGGGIGFGFGTNITFVGISPQVSYLVKRIVEPGVAFRYQYTRDRFPIEDAIWHTYGASLFVRLYPIPSLFFLIEGEIINTGFRQGDFYSGRDNYGNLFLGGGYMIGLGKGAFMGLSLKVNVFRNPFYPGNFPIISIGAGYAF
ncbi:MAG: hypothetical protein O7F08_04870 [Deltaproteobacteria bacterium]|nr:hypothetical protein [Deltaproteobacteria bacterium]